MNLSKKRDITKAKEALKLHKHKDWHISAWQEQKTNINFKMHHYAFLGMGGENEGRSSWVLLHFFPWLLGLDKARDVIPSSCKTLPEDPIIAWLPLTWAHWKNPHLLQDWGWRPDMQVRVVSYLWKQHFVWKEEVCMEKKVRSVSYSWSRRIHTHYQLSHTKMSLLPLWEQMLFTRQAALRWIFSMWQFFICVQLSFPKQPYVL